MANRNFREDNPALDILGQDTIDRVDNPEKKEEKPAGKKAKGKGKTASQNKPEKKAKDKGKAKASAPKGKTPKGYKPNPEYIETKSKRVQILIQPSVHEAVQAKAKKMGISTNEAINEALRKYVGK